MPFDHLGLDAIAMNPARQPVIQLMDAWLTEGRPPSDVALSGAFSDIYDDPCVAFLLREVFVQRYGFAVPLPSTVAEIASMGPILEVAAGTGYLSRLLEQAGAEVIATDGGDPGDFGLTAGTWYPVMTGTDAAEAIRQAPEFTVVLSWPDEGDWAVRALDALAPGQRLILIGEGRGGCCASQTFFDRLASDFERERALSHLTALPSLHDTVEVWRRIR